MKNVCLLLLVAIPLYSAMIPIYPESADKPDSAHVKSETNNELLYTVKYSYTTDGYLAKEVYYYEGQQTGYVECHYQKTGDTIKCTYTITEEPDNQYVDLYIFDNNNKIVRYMGYDGPELYDDELILYNQDGKISKTIVATASLTEDIGDSIVYKYQNGHIKTVDIYGDGGSKWYYSGYETDNSGRVIKSTEYDCENGCVTDGEYMVYFYGNTSVLHSHSRAVTARKYDIFASNGIVSVIMHDGTRLYHVDAFDLIGNRLQKVASSDNKTVSIESKNFPSRRMILQLHTSSGKVNVPVFGEE